VIPIVRATLGQKRLRNLDAELIDEQNRFWSDGIGETSSAAADGNSGGGRQQRRQHRAWKTGLAGRPDIYMYIHGRHWLCDGLLYMYVTIDGLCIICTYTYDIRVLETQGQGT
jgi:hypothetical protein